MIQEAEGAPVFFCSGKGVSFCTRSVVLPYTSYFFFFTSYTFTPQLVYLNLYTSTYLCTDSWSPITVLIEAKKVSSKKTQKIERGSGKEERYSPCCDDLCLH